MTSSLPVADWLGGGWRTPDSAEPVTRTPSSAPVSLEGDILPSSGCFGLGLRKHGVTPFGGLYCKVYPSAVWDGQASCPVEEKAERETEYKKMNNADLEVGSEQVRKRMQIQWHLYPGSNPSTLPALPLWEVLQPAC